VPEAAEGSMQLAPERAQVSEQSLAGLAPELEREWGSAQPAADATRLLLARELEPRQAQASAQGLRSELAAELVREPAPELAPQLAREPGPEQELAQALELQSARLRARPAEAPSASGSPARVPLQPLVLAPLRVHHLAIAHRPSTAQKLQRRLAPKALHVAA
jgi:hypothetical protein